MNMTRKPKGFTLIELLIVVGIIAVLASLVALMAPSLKTRGQQAASLGNLRQISTAVFLFAGDNDGRFPKRVVNRKADKWPALLHEYLDDTKVYAEPGNPSNHLATGKDPLSNSPNHTSYIMNGYNDIGALDDPEIEVRIQQLEKPGSVILFGTPNIGSEHFYMDMLEGRGNHNDVLNLEAYNGGSNYAFADGSARFIKKGDYSHELWLVNKTFEVP